LGKASGVAALLLALVLKAFYGRAGATELLWILAPSAWLARVVGGIDLVYEQGAGFISHTHHLVVGPACAGVNFLIICFLCLFFSFARYCPNKVNWLVYSLLIAFAATVAANGLRIFVAAHLRDADFYRNWITQEGMHRLAGIVIYYASLLALYYTVESRLGSAPKMAPFVWYVGITLAVPLAGRIVTQGTPAFAEHATWVMAVALFLTAVLHLSRETQNSHR